MAGRFENLLGTILTTFGIGPKGARTTFDAGSVTAARTITLPDATGTLALTSDITGGDVRDAWLFG